MTTAEKYRQLEKSPVINTARYIFKSIRTTSKITTVGAELEDIRTGKTPSKQEIRFYEDNYFNWFKPDEIGSEKYLYEAFDKISKYAIERNQVTIYKPETILINAIGDIGRVSILKIKASSNQQITGIRFKKSVLPEYAYYYLVSNREYFYVDLFKTTLPIINQKKIITLPFILPDYEEQKRIVSGLELIEKIETINDIKIINSIDWNDEYKVACNFFFKVQFNTETLLNEQTHQLTTLKKLRQQILQDAVQGKLVPQDRNDEPANQLLERIKAEKEQLIKEKIIRKEKHLPEIKPEEIPFEIPESWMWCRMGELTNEIIGGFAFDSQRYSKTETNNQVIRLGNVKPNQLVLSTSPVYIENNYAEEAWKSKLLVGDILITMTGTRAKRDYLFTLLINEEDLGFKKLYLNQRVGCFRFAPSLSKEFLNHVITDTRLLEPVFLSATGAANQANIGVVALREIFIPLAPINEQCRIVTKIEQLMKLCDELENTIQKNQKYTHDLLQVALKKALEPKQN